MTCNVLEMQVEGERLLTPPGLPICIPPGHQHASDNHKQALFAACAIYPGAEDASVPCFMAEYPLLK
ncbi:Uncharacterized HTH-type transcriptional regulator yeaM [Erwinia sp. Ejp617]|nr:hypothetical protein [Erwinia sp. Ejp617]ADP13151.1 Uncharacterized HTH-type transcriptional regulator yeaM [Erwinia sp. Ejp617]